MGLGFVSWWLVTRRCHFDRTEVVGLCLYVRLGFLTRFPLVKTPT